MVGSRLVFPATLTALLLFAATSARGADSAARLYATSCASCHGERGQGSDIAPSLLGKSAADLHFMLDTGRMPAAVPQDNEIHRLAQFTPAQITSLVRYVQNFSPQHARDGAALPRADSGDVNRGRTLFADNCAQCHGASADGASVGYANVAPSLADDSPLQIAEAIRTGPSVMPRFGNDVLNDAEVSDIIAYVVGLRAAKSPVDAGGLGLSHIGPVAEGFVAWLFSVGALVFFVRRIGEAGRSSPSTFGAETPEAKNQAAKPGSEQ